MASHRSEPTRGGRKLEAAIDAFALAPKLRGAKAIDVGASTGGFSRALLAHGAVHVTAIDVGHGQLDPDLQVDARVTSFEGVDFKRAPLTLASGPFDAFGVDVSFVAARNMLRSLAFRLRAGAEGIVLVKPQFELPRGAEHASAAARKTALGRFEEKARELGFAILAHRDSPVPGGSGTIEVLAHLRFEGRPSSMPALGERRGPKPKSPRAVRSPLGPDARWFLVAAPGLEACVLDEALLLPGATDVRAVPGGVELRGGFDVGLRANLQLRTPTRVLLRLGEAHARDFAPLRRALARLPWAALLPAGRPLRIDAATTRCRLYHTGALAETVTLAISDAMGKAPTLAPKGASDDDADAAPEVARVLLRGEGDVFTVSVDASGPLLHRRGWRLEAGAAPLRETLAAGLLALAQWKPGQEPLVDPMCGAGTIAIEAAAIARGRAPGLERSFACEAWPIADAAVVQDVRAAAAIAGRPSVAPIVGFDRDAGVIERARRNAERAGLEADLRLDVAELASATAPAPTGLLLANPPYGQRLPTGGAGRLAGAIGRALKGPFRGWRAALLVPSARAPHPIARAIGLPVLRSHPLRNGGLRVELLVFAAARP